MTGPDRQERVLVCRAGDALCESTPETPREQGVSASYSQNPAPTTNYACARRGRGLNRIPRAALCTLLSVWEHRSLLLLESAHCHTRLGT